MRSSFIIITCCMLAMVMSQAPPDLIPVEYGLPLPFVFEDGSNEYWTTFNMCRNPPYQNCYVRTRVNLPQKKWDVNAGYFANLQVYTSNAGQCTLVAQNNINDPTSPGLADFLYVIGSGNVFYIRLTNSVTTGFVGTLDVHIVCDASQKSEFHGKKIEKKEVIPCGNSQSLMSMTYRSVDPINFPTSVGFSDWLQMKIPVCMGEQYSGLRYKGIATDTYSAASTRACSFSPCNVNADIAVDRSGSAINSFDLFNINNRTIYVAFEGFGTFGGNNNFQISFEAF